MTRALSLLSILLLAACTGPAGEDGKNGSNGSNGEDGTSGLDGTDGTDGEDGTDGTDGTDGADGVDGEDLMAEPTELTFEITDVSIDATSVVTFMVYNEDDEPFNGLDTDSLSANGMRFAIAKLVPGEDGDSDSWQSYLNTTEDTTDSEAGPDGVPVLTEATQATYETSGTLAYLGSGEYTYTFAADFTAVTDPIEVDYEPDLLHRVAIQIEYPVGDEGEELIYNVIYDFVPTGGDAPATRYMVSTDSCNECHTDLAIHGGGRIDTDYCVTCHNPGSTDANSGESVDLSQMVHKIHMGHALPSVEDGGSYTIWGYRDGEHDYSHVGYPQDQTNCMKCHNQDDAETPDAGNWMARPTMEACGSCHDTVDFATGDGHDGGAMADNSLCAVCHTDDNIVEYHLTSNATPNNPELPDGVYEILYEILSAEVDADNVLTVTYSLTADGTELDMTSLPDDLSRSPTFILAYAMAQDGYDAPTEWNNLGLEAGQPETVSLATLVADGVEGGTYSYSGGVNTMVLEDAFPEGATMRTVGLQGYFSQTVDDTSYSLHTISVYMTVDGDDERRVVVDAEGCASCHEWFEGHGGNRVYETQVCAMCHNPSLSSSGRELDLDYPEASNNLKDMIHGIHGASVRDYPLDFVRNRSGGSHYTFVGSEDMLEEYPDATYVAYPSDPAYCEKCHLEDTWLPEEVPSGSLPSTHFVGADAEDTDAVTTWRETVPNDDDWIIGPTSAACASCHNSDAAMAHMDLNGGTVMANRSELVEDGTVEACAVCHDDGSTASTREMHGQ